MEEQADRSKVRLPLKPLPGSRVKLLPPIKLVAYRLPRTEIMACFVAGDEALFIDAPLPSRSGFFLFFVALILKEKPMVANPVYYSLDDRRPLIFFLRFAACLAELVEPTKEQDSV